MTFSFNTKRLSVIVLFTLLYSLPSSLIMLKSYKDIQSVSEPLKKEAQRILRNLKISLESNIELNHSSPDFFKEAAIPFIQNGEILLMKIANHSGKTAFSYGAVPENTPYITVSTTIGRLYSIGFLLEITVPDRALAEKAASLADSIASENSKALWLFNIDEIRNNISVFFNDRSISSIEITTEKGTPVAKKSRDYIMPVKEAGKITREIRYEGRPIGYVNLVLSDYETSATKFRFYITAAADALLFVLLLITLNWILLRSRDRDIRNSVQISTATETKINLAIEYIKENYSRNISREGLAAHIGLNADNFGRYFKHHTGRKLNECINHLRVSEAKKLLEETDSTITHIALEVGFDNISTFNRAFRAEFKTTPRELRRRSCGK